MLTILPGHEVSDCLSDKEEEDKPPPYNAATCVTANCRQLSITMHDARLAFHCGAISVKDIGRPGCAVPVAADFPGTITGVWSTCDMEGEWRNGSHQIHTDSGLAPSSSMICIRMSS